MEPEAQPKEAKGEMPQIETGGTLRTAVSVILGILVILALALVGGRIVQNIIKQRTSREVVRNNIITPMPIPMPAVSDQDVLPVQMEGPQARELPAAGPGVSILFLIGAGALGFFLRSRKP